MPAPATLRSPTRRTRPRTGLERPSPGPRAIPRGAASSRSCASIAPSRPSDEDLLGRYRDFREPSDFAELVRRYSRELGRYLARYLGDETLAEDVLQETFLRVHAKCGLYRDGWPARPWLYAVAMHRAIDALRQCRHPAASRPGYPHRDAEPVEASRLVELLADDEPGPLAKLQERERQAWVRNSVARLPEPLRQALELAHYEGLSYAEIALRLGVPLGTVKSRLHGAIARLRAMAGRQEQAEGR
jgi:RNA polymerase sigma-70 factor (ECF subfamily)